MSSNGRPEDPDSVSAAAGLAGATCAECFLQGRAQFLPAVPGVALEVQFDVVVDLDGDEVHGTESSRDLALWTTRDEGTSKLSGDFVQSYGVTILGEVSRQRNILSFLLMR